MARVFQTGSRTRRGSGLGEIRIHGRGGQGSVVAARLLALALFRQGYQVQAFPALGSERRGAPVTAFLRFDRRLLRLRCQIYRPDHLIVLEPSLLEQAEAEALEGLKPGGWVVVNTDKTVGALNLPPRFNVAVVDASGIAMACDLGSPGAPIANTAILGAFAKATALVKIENVLWAIEQGVPRKPHENTLAARKAYEQCVVTTSASAR